MATSMMRTGVNISGQVVLHVHMPRNMIDAIVDWCTMPRSRLLKGCGVDLYDERTREKAIA